MKRRNLLVLANIVLLFVGGRSVLADDQPSWFEQDTKAKDGWTFYCRSDAADEKNALAQAQADCSRKMCMLFGVEVEYKQTSTETLKDAKSESTVIEKCPNVRIMGRVDKKKSIECEDKTCTAFVSQFYPMTNYIEEFKRLNSPAISSQLVIREGNDTFKDPGACKKALAEFKASTGVGEKNRKLRIAILKRATGECQSLDYRNVDLQNELSSDLYSNFSGRGALYGSAVTPLVSVKPKITDKIAAALDLEMIDQTQSAKKIQKLVAQNYDHLYFRQNHYSTYTDELKSCGTLAKIVKGWPKAYFDPVNVCVASDDEHPEVHEKDCQDASYTMIRAQYVGCVCNRGAPQRSQRCFEVINQHLNETCPLEMTEACFRSMSTDAAEKMKMKMDVFDGVEK